MIDFKSAEEIRGMVTDIIGGHSRSCTFCKCIATSDYCTCNISERKKIVEEMYRHLKQIIVLVETKSELTADSMMADAIRNTILKAENISVT